MLHYQCTFTLEDKLLFCFLQVLFLAFSSCRITNTNTCNFLPCVYYSFTPHSLISSPLSSVSPFLFHTKLSLTHFVWSHLTPLVYACVCLRFLECLLPWITEWPFHTRNKHFEPCKATWRNNKKILTALRIIMKGRNSVHLLPSNLSHQSAYDRSKGRRNFKF